MNISKALVALRPNATWEMEGEDYNNLIWKDTEQTKPTLEEVTAKVAELNAEYASTQYQRNRVSEYPPIGDQLDALFHAGVFPQEMADKIQAVKNKYPKGSE
jgi:hypothetical protein